MSAEALRLDSAPAMRRLVDEWAEGLAQVLESMTDRKPEVHWKPASGTLSEVRADDEAAESAGPDSELLWWEQPFLTSPGSAAWVAAPHGTWEFTGSLTLKAAGLETVEAGEARNTWFEILGQSLGSMARSMSAILGHEVACDTGSEHAPDQNPREWAAVSVKLGDSRLPTLWLALSAAVGALLTAPVPEAAPEPPEVSPPMGMAQTPPARSRTMDLLLDVDLPISISFGRTHLPMKDVLKLTTGSIVELNRGVSDSVEVLVNQCLIARGEVVVVEGNYGVRIQEIASRQDRLRSIR
jgi:flagellar motor switch protein FliN/FliY